MGDTGTPKKHEERVVTTKEEEVFGFKHSFFELVRVLLLAIVIIVPIHTFLFQPFFVSGSSMVPNFHDGEYLIVNELGYKQTSDIRTFLGDIPIGFTVMPFRELSRGDIAVFEFSRNPEQFYIKRIIGLPGESVEIRKGKVLITRPGTTREEVVDESLYLSRAAALSMQDMKPVTLTEDQYFLMGDNRSFSHDSRAIGPIGKDRIIGRVVVRAWPLSDLTWY